MQQSPLHQVHEQLGARLVDFAGWHMPLYFTSIQQEHIHTRTSASIFDVSHMGRIRIEGKDGEAFLDKLCTRRIASMETGVCRYSHVCNSQGGILDDIIVMKYPKDWLVVCNASNRDKILEWFQSHSADHDVKIIDTTTSTLMIALQGPEAIESVKNTLPIPFPDLKRYRFHTGTYMFTSFTISRTGYTGEDGIELILPASVAPLLAQTLMSTDPSESPFRPAGLGARDTLRLEAAMPLYGHELNEEIDPISAGCKWCVNLDKDFIGADVLRKIAKEGPARRLVGMKLAGKRIARPETAVLNNDTRVGFVTSGTYGPTLQASIAMGYVDAGLASPGTSLSVQTGSKTTDATVVELPFYKRGRS